MDHHWHIELSNPSGATNYYTRHYNRTNDCWSALAEICSTILSRLLQEDDEIYRLRTVDGIATTTNK